MKRVLAALVTVLCCSSANAQATNPGDPLPAKLSALDQLDADIASAPSAAQGGAAFYAIFARRVISNQQANGQSYDPYFLVERKLSPHLKEVTTVDPVHNLIIWSRYCLNQAVGQPASLNGYYRTVQFVVVP